MSEASVVQTVRAMGYDVFVVPSEQAGLQGQAFATEGCCHINLFIDPRTPQGAHVLWHEVGHHERGHTVYQSTYPQWVMEYEAERFALAKMKPCTDPETYARIEDAVKAYLRPLLQGELDYGHDPQFNRAIAEWAGCDMTPRGELVEILHIRPPHLRAPVWRGVDFGDCEDEIPF